MSRKQEAPSVSTGEWAAGLGHVDPEQLAGQAERVGDAMLHEVAVPFGANEAMDAELKDGHGAPPAAHTPKTKCSLSTESGMDAICSDAQ